MKPASRADTRVLYASCEWTALKGIWFQLVKNIELKTVSTVSNYAFQTVYNSRAALYVEELTKDAVGQQTVKQYTRYMMFVVAVAQSFVTAGL